LNCTTAQVFLFQLQAFKLIKFAKQYKANF
jgi:hypothetical protein